MKKLPISRQTFSELIEENCLYIDKTRDIYNMMNSSGKYFFISRPRRFGKSLLVSTLKEIFSGNKELFKGLYIYDKITWDKYPVIHLDFTELDYRDDKELRKSLIFFLNKINNDYKLNIVEEGFKTYFSSVIENLCRNYGQAVILIDEYDKPIIDYITDLQKSSENREVLREFYSVLKGTDEYIKFVFITGVSKFSKVSIFSGLNNLIDLTLEEDFNKIMGITQEELETCFADYIERLKEKEKGDKNEILDKIKFWYDGYSWDGITRLYNPFSILNLFNSRKFRNYWFGTGTTTFLIKLIKNNKYEITNLENITAGDMVFESYDIENMDITSLLFQTGYLSIKKTDEEQRLYTLSYPNMEVKESFLNYLLSNFINENVSHIRPLYMNLIKYFREEKIEKAIDIIKSIFAKIPYTLHIPSESYYHSLFYMILSLMGVKIDIDVLSDKGRIDGLMEFSDKVYLIEFKYEKSGSDMEKILDKAIKQIKDKKYYERFIGEGKRIIFLGVAFIDKEIGYRKEEKQENGQR